MAKGNDVERGENRGDSLWRQERETSGLEGRIPTLTGGVAEAVVSFEGGIASSLI